MLESNCKAAKTPVNAPYFAAPVSIVRCSAQNAHGSQTAHCNSMCM